MPVLSSLLVVCTIVVVAGRECKTIIYKGKTCYCWWKTMTNSNEILLLTGSISSMPLTFSLTFLTPRCHEHFRAFVCQSQATTVSTRGFSLFYLQWVFCCFVSLSVRKWHDVDVFVARTQHFVLPLLSLSYHSFLSLSFFLFCLVVASLHSEM